MFRVLFRWVVAVAVVTRNICVTFETSLQHIVPVLTMVAATAWTLR